MPNPSQPLIRDEFSGVLQAFATSPDRDRFLLEVCASNEKLAETLLIFRNRLDALSADDIFLHYVVNTDGPIAEEAGVDSFDVFAAATRYAEALGVGVRRGARGESYLQLNGKEEECPEWGSLPDSSDARSLRQVGPVINRARYGRNDVIPSRAFDFDEASAGHTLENAMILADLASLAYFERDYVKKLLSLWGYERFHWIEEADTDTQAFVTGKGAHLVVCFRGTSSKTDALTDIKFRKTTGPGGHGKVHRGFNHALDSVWDELHTAVGDLGGQKLFVTGHSLGAALAQLAAFRLALAGRAVAGVYVYGSPRVGDREFADAYNGRLGSKTFLHINNNDVVTRVPPSIFGFRHLGDEPRRFDRGHEISHESDEEATEEKDFEELTTEQKRDAVRKIEQARDAIESGVRYLNTPPAQLQAGSYETTFEAGPVDDHGMAEYLFKFSCAIVDGEWDRLRKKLENQA